MAPVWCDHGGMFEDCADPTGGTGGWIGVGFVILGAALGAAFCGAGLAVGIRCAVSGIRLRLDAIRDAAATRLSTADSRESQPPSETG